MNINLNGITQIIQGLLSNVCEWFDGLNWGTVPDWFGAIGTIGAVWIAVSYRRTKIKYGVDATVIASAIKSDKGSGSVSKPRFELDIFNINDPDLLIKDIEVEYDDGTVISNFLQAEPIVIRGFEATRIDTDRVKEWVSDMSKYKFLKKQNPKVVVVLAGNKRRKFKINFINLDGAE